MKTARFVLAACLLTANPAWADIDYNCLNHCAASGKAGATCIPICTYQPPRASSGNGVTLGSGGPAAAGNLGYTHRLLPTLQPIGENTIVTKAKPPEVTATKNYQCIAQCLQGNMRYEMCEESCIDIATTSGAKITGAPTGQTAASFGGAK